MNEIEIRIGARDDTDQGTRSAENRLNGLQRVGATAAAGLGAAGLAGGALFAKGLADNMNIEVANDKLAAQLGLTTEEAKKAGEVAGDVYGNNWGGSIEEVNAAIKSVGDNLGDVGKMSKTELQGMTENALALAQTFDVDVSESTRAAGALMKNGLAKDSTEAFDIITAGMQNGVDKSGDLIDTLEEYAPQFAKLGLDGKQSLGILSDFLKAGARDTDVAADAFKEFGLRAIDGSKESAEAFKDLGLNGKEMGAQIAEGGEGAVKGLDQVIKGLQGIKDPVEQNRIGTQLFGTTWEDTVRSILPGLDITKSGIENVDGATKRMADTVGDNAQGKIDTLKRGFEQWTQKMAESSGVMGTLVTGTASFGPGAMEAVTAIGLMTVAMRGLNLTMLMNPIGLVVAAIALLVGGLVLLWQKSQTAREIMSTAFSAIAQLVLENVDVMLKVFQGLSNAILTTVEVMLNALGKIPGNDWADRAADDVRGFRDGVDKFFDDALGKTEEWRTAAENLPKKIRLEGEMSDLREKVDAAKAKLKTVPKSKRSVIDAEIRQAESRIDYIKRQLASVPRYVGTTVNTHYTTSGSRTAPSEFMAHGGISGAASGGARGSWTMVGEQGRELVKLPYGSQVVPHGTTENMMQAGNGGSTQGMRLEVSSGGSRLDDLLVEILRKAIRAQGGDVQFVLGH